MTTPLPGYLGTDPFDPGTARALDAGSSADWDAVSEEVGPRVRVLPLFGAEACARLLAEIDARVREQATRSATPDPPNSMHAYGAVLGDLGMDDLLFGLRALVAPLSERWFPDVGGSALDGQHGFLAEYGGDADDALGYHVDDSAVTLNVCLGTSFSGSELYFRGLRCDGHRQSPARRDEAFEVEHVPGTAILHAGRHRHGVHPIRRGRRRNLILWMQSSSAKEAARTCQPWCGAHRAATT